MRLYVSVFSLRKRGRARFRPCWPTTDSFQANRELTLDSRNRSQSEALFAAPTGSTAPRSCAEISWRGERRGRKTGNLRTVHSARFIQRARAAASSTGEANTYIFSPSASVCVPSESLLKRFSHPPVVLSPLVWLGCSVDRLRREPRRLRPEIWWPSLCICYDRSRPWKLASDVFRKLLVRMSTQQPR